MAVRSPMAGIIDPAKLYRIDAAQQVMGWGKLATDAAKSRGLRILRSGKRRYVLGADLVAFVQKDSEARAAQ